MQPRQPYPYFNKGGSIIIFNTHTECGRLLVTTSAGGLWRILTTTSKADRRQDALTRAMRIAAIKAISTNAEDSLHVYSLSSRLRVPLGRARSVRCSLLEAAGGVRCA
ncbi:hypothetical protein N7G274_006109 [Stereocaulon virgatum]|uniref:Uncharacterized protein n=1 Tax=Stereocaulon virgatum TaxID=373712 RepID=A0ABR4A5R9_9LECA